MTQPTTRRKITKKANFEKGGETKAHQGGAANFRYVSYANWSTLRCTRNADLTPTVLLILFSPSRA